MKYGKKRLLLPLIFAGLTIVFFFSSKVLAQTANNYDVTVSPIFFDLSANPGDTVKTKIRVRNNTNSPIPLKLGVQKLSGDENGNLTLKQDKNDYTLSWVKIPSDTILTKPLEWTDIPFTVEVPKDAAFGYYWTITFTQDVNSKYAKNGVSLTGAAAVPVLLNVRKEGAKISGKLISFSSDSGFYEYPPFKFITKFQNNGNIHIRPKGSIFIKNWLGQEMATMNFNDQQGTILPNSLRIFTNSWNEGFITKETKMSDGQPKVGKDGKVETELKIHWDKIVNLRIGRYTASALLLVSTPQRDMVYQEQTSFWVFPWKVLGIIALIAIFAFVGLYSTFKNLFKKVFALLGPRKSHTKEE